MKRLWLLISAFCLLSVFISNAQKDFYPGYIITLENDTVYGTINLGTSIQNSQKCIFRNTNSKKSQEIYPSDISVYVIANQKHFISKEITLNEVTQKVFLEYLVDGIVDLYFIKADGNNYYYVEKEGKMYLLSNDEVESYPNGRLEIKPSQKYKGVLSFLFQDDPTSLKKSTLVPYSNKSLIRFTKDYHNRVCTDYACIDYTKNTKPNIYIEPIVGINLSRLMFRTSKDYGDDASPVLGFNMRIIPSNSFHLINFNTSLSYSCLNINHTYINSIRESFYFTSGDIIRSIAPRYDYPANVKTKYSYINLPFLIDYQFPLKKIIQPFVFLGINNVFIIKSSYSVSYTSITHDMYYHPIYTEYYATPEFKKYHIGFLGGIGLRFFTGNSNYLFIKGQYEYRVPSSKRGYFLDYQRVNSLQVLFGYGFKI
ncbi:outer membrane beta-barrel protein [Saccharicrinis sp. FJH62]|uniref:outer membrane beta-barrel protein n=1 Tax=Saccharicrinis sp. FJH62 TaxID=3344657 RepID=UPI0035D4FDD4